MQVYDGSKSALPADPHRHLTLDESCPPLSPPQKVASAGASRSGVLYVNPNSSPERRLVRLDLCTSRISDCATSDIGGRNSGSACAAPQRWMETAREREREGLRAWSCRLEYLNAERDHVRETRERFGRVHAVQSRVDHLRQQVDVVQLRRRPPHQRLLRPRLGTETYQVSHMSASPHEE